MANDDAKHMVSLNEIGGFNNGLALFVSSPIREKMKRKSEREKEKRFNQSGVLSDGLIFQITICCCSDLDRPNLTLPLRHSRYVFNLSWC